MCLIKDNKGRFCKKYDWDKNKESYFINNYGNESKVDICRKLNINNHVFYLKVKELSLNLSDSFNNSKKQCTKCKQFLPRNKDYFNTNKNKDGIFFRSACKKCSKEVYFKTHSELDYYIKNLIRSKKYDKRKRFKNIEFDIDLEFIKKMFLNQNGICEITGISMTHFSGKGFCMSNLSIDRIDSKKGYTKDNIQLVCLWANVSKNNMNLEDFKKYINLTYKKICEL